MVLLISEQAESVVPSCQGCCGPIESVKLGSPVCRAASHPGTGPEFLESVHSVLQFSQMHRDAQNWRHCAKGYIAL